MQSIIDYAIKRAQEFESIGKLIKLSGQRSFAADQAVNLYHAVASMTTSSSTTTSTKTDNELKTYLCDFVNQRIPLSTMELFAKEDLMNFLETGESILPSESSLLDLPGFLEKRQIQRLAKIAAEEKARNDAKKAELEKIREQKIIKEREQELHRLGIFDLVKKLDQTGSK